MNKKCLGYISIVVDDYDRAIDYYINKLGFTLIEDTPQPGKRWVVVHRTPTVTVICYYPERLMKPKKHSSVTNVEDAYSCFCKPMIFGVITMK